MDKYYCLKMEGVKEGQEAICSHFIWNDNENDLGKGEFTIKNGYLIVNYDNGIGGIDNFKKWLNAQKEKGCPITIHYVLDKPIISEIHDSDMCINIFKSKNYNIEEVSMNYGLNAFLLFKCDFPYYLQIPNGVYCIKTDVDLSKNLQSISNEKRKILYCISRECINNQKISTKSGSFQYKPNTEDYYFFTTKIDLIIEIKKEDYINNIFSDNNEDDIRILQSALELMATKYNEALAGKDIWRPFAQEIGAERMAYFVKEESKNTYEITNAIITPGININSTEELEKEKLESIINQPYNIWRYFYNEAKYCFDNYNNIECIIYSAICIESYVYNLIQSHSLNQEFIDYQKSKNRINYSFFHIVEFLESKNVFTKADRDFLNSAFGKINGIRNDIVHGKISTPILSRENAKIAKEGAISIIKWFEK